MPLSLRLLDASCRALVRCAPESFRRAWTNEIHVTFREACMNARTETGLVGLARLGLLELFDVAMAALRARRGRSLPITGGHTPHRPIRKGPSPVHTLMQDFNLAVRSLTAAPSHMLIVVLTLALGIGVNVGLFSVLDALLFRPAPFADADRLVDLWNEAEESKVQFPSFNRPLLREWSSQTDLFDKFEAFDDDVRVFQAVGGAETVEAAAVTAGLLPMLGVAPQQGRHFLPGEGRDGTDQVAMISARFWRSKLGGRDDVIGSTLTINNRRFVVVGVMPASFHFPYRSTEVWTPVDAVLPPGALATPSFTMQPVVRLAPGVSMSAALTGVRARGARLQQATGGDAGVTAVARPRNRVDADATSRALKVSGAGVVFLLLIVCANIANLSLSRALSRGRDFAVRSALGASRADLIRQTIVEHLVIGMAGTVLGVAVAWGVVEITNVSLPVTMTSQSLNAIDMDGRALGIAMMAGFLTALLFGLPPALLGSRPDLLAVMTQHSRSTTGNASARRWRAGLVIAEVTMAMVLLTGAALMARSLMTLESLDRGFDTSGLFAVRVGLPAPRYASPAARDLFTDDLLSRLQRLPGVQHVTAGGVPPNPSGSSYGALEFAHRPGEKTEMISAPFYRVWPGFFGQIGLRITEGREFQAQDPLSTVIVSQSFAKKYWTDSSAVGGQFRFIGATTWRTVVGVSTEVRQMSLDDEYGSFEWFVPLQAPAGAAPQRRPGYDAIVEQRSFVVRAVGGTTLDDIRRLVYETDPSVVIWSASTVDEAFARAVARPRVLLRVLMIFGFLGLALAAGGLYGVLSHLVTQRMREIGVRLALGATPTGVFGLILRQGVALTALGLLIGFGATTLLGPMMRSVLYQVAPSDPQALLAVAALLSLTALVACWRPARRAMKVDPVSLLREQ